MAKHQILGGNGDLFRTDDKSFVMEVTDKSGIPVNVSGFTTAMVVSLTEKTAALLTISGSVSGSYNASRAVNTQRVTFTVSDTTMETLTNKQYYFSVKRTDTDSETILAYGPFIVERANQ